MTDPYTALDRLRAANPVRTTRSLPEEELAAVVAACEQRLAQERAPGAARSPVQVVDRVRRRPGLRPALVFGLAFVAVAVVVGVVMLVPGAEEPVIAPDVASTTAPTTTVPVRTVGGVSYVDHLVYYADAERTFETSVFFPAKGSGPWPVAVVYSEFAVGDQERTLARQIAERGAVVFAPVWVDEGTGVQTPAEYLTGGMWDRAACAVGYAQSHAAQYGGDPRRTTLVGDAGGEHPAAWTALGFADTSACSEPILHAPTGLVAGESQWLFQQASFDQAFSGPDAAAVDVVDRFFNPERWQVPEDFSVFLWATAWTGNANSIDDPPAADSWIWTRDPDGDLVADLAAVGAFDDGLITFSDNSRLMELRMTLAGIDVTYYESDDPGYEPDAAALDGVWSLFVE